MDFGPFIEPEDSHPSEGTTPPQRGSSFDEHQKTRSTASSVSSLTSPQIKRKLSVDIPRLPDDDNFEVINNSSLLRTSAMTIPELPKLSETSTLSSSATSSAASIPLRIKKSQPADPETTKTDAVSINYSSNDAFSQHDEPLAVDGDPEIPHTNGDSLSTPVQTPGSTFMSSIKNLASISQQQQEADMSTDSVATLATPVRTSSQNDDDQGRLEHTVNGHTEMLSFRRTSRRAKSSSISSLPKTPLTDASNDSFDRSPADFSNKLYTDEKYLDTQYRYASLTRNVEFHDLFKNVPENDRLLDDFSCALSREILLQGRLYVSEHYLCFNSNLLGWVTSLMISHDEIVHFERKSTAGLFPNGIVVETKDGKHTFASFISRDSTLNFLETIWSKSVALSKSKNEKSRSLDLIESNIAAPVGNQLSEDDIFTIDENGPLMDGQSENEVVITPVYKNGGPDEHTPTEHDYEPEAHGESIILDRVFDGPMGLVFDVLFGEKTTFHRHIMELSDGYNFSEYGPFDTGDEESSRPTREFVYEKRLNNSIGPKSAKVETSETIEHKDFNEYVEVTTKASTPNVPSGTAFHVFTRYLFTWAENSQTHLVISYKIVWTGSSWIKGVIEKSTRTGQQKSADLIGDEMEELLPTIKTGKPEELKNELEEKTEVVAEPAPTPSANYMLMLERISGNWLGILVFAILHRAEHATAEETVRGMRYLQGMHFAELVMDKLSSRDEPDVVGVWRRLFVFDNFAVVDAMDGYFVVCVVELENKNPRDHTLDGVVAQLGKVGHRAVKVEEVDVVEVERSKLGAGGLVVAEMQTPVETGSPFDGDFGGVRRGLLGAVDVEQVVLDGQVDHVVAGERSCWFFDVYVGDM
ncbi:hypothetical protein OGAPHI_004552 [Ogataea philodendri]|uniref:VASt domain-containing protein n=1 Tax=Ogataea philodendri TaxID=1378263 RepID=A0A9P8T306_9ASCO|nr:uncharacterized protein OGAPHI_004552 [Ogataea philodendri]KAH3664201.1 hypothetical protein OGAPHI_004552 [Ogataea philodendri]